MIEFAESTRKCWRKAVRAADPARRSSPWAMPYLAAGQLSELSERRVLGGNQHALPADIFATADYTALGHLHLAQSPAEGVHYNGSPLPLSLAEANYNHQVLEVTFEGASWRGWSGSLCPVRWR